jgi:glycosyltransferase 2 family protein
MKNKSKWGAAIIGIGISIFFLWLGFRSLDPAQVLAEIRNVNVLLLLLATGLYFFSLGLITVRWRFVLNADAQTTLPGLMSLVAIGYMGNNVYPFRAGEMLRIFLLQRHTKIPLGQGATTVLIERIFDGLVMITFIIVGAMFANVDSPLVRGVVIFTAPLFLLGLITFFVLAARPNWMRAVAEFFARFLPAPLRKIALQLTEEVIIGLAGLRSPARLLGVIAFSYLAWMVEAAVYWLVALAFGLPLAYPVMLMVVGVANLAGLIPASPGQIGVYEFFVAAVLMAVGVANAQAKAYALVVHMVIWLPVTLAGAVLLLRQGLGFGAIRQASQIEIA